MRVLIADDHRLVLEGVRAVLAESEGIEVVATATSGSEVLPLIGRTHPDVVLLDIRMPEFDGLSCLDQIRVRFPNVKVVILSAFSDHDHIDAALRRGASGYVVKSVNPVDLASALRQSLEGRVFHTATGPEDTSLSQIGLTARESEILKAVARGLSNQAIGKEFWVTEQTVKYHLTNVYRKLGVTNRAEAVRFAYEHGLAENVA